jgi:hypothetical protein
MTNEERRAGFAKARATNEKLEAQCYEILAQLEAEVGPKAESLREQQRKNLAQIAEWDRLLDEADPRKWN